MPGLFRRPPQPTQKVRTLVAIQSGPASISVALIDQTAATFAPVIGTKLYFRIASSDYQTGTNDTKLNGVAASTWINRLLSESPGSSVSGLTTSTVAGPTDGIEVAQTNTHNWWTPPLGADVTISQQITWNLWASESNSVANVAINGVVEKVDGATGAITEIDRTSRTTEVNPTTRSVNNFAETPSAGVACKKGDRLRIRVYGDDAGTMSGGHTFNFGVDGPTEGADGDSWVVFSDALTFAATPAGTTLYPQTTLSDVVDAQINKSLLTAAPSGANSDQVTSVTGWTDPLQVKENTASAEVSWYSNRLQAFTLGGAVTAALRGLVSSQVSVSLRAEIAVCDSDGSNPVVWAAGTQNVELTTSFVVNTIVLGGDDYSVSDGQRLRLRVYADDYNTGGAMGAGSTVSFSQNTSLTFLTFSQTLTELTGPIVALIDRTATTFNPTVTPGAVSVTPNFIDRTAAPFEPALSLTVFPGFITQTATTFNPTVTSLATVVPGFVNQAASPFSPTVTSLATISVNQISQTASPFTPTVSTDVGLPVITQTAATFAPTVISSQLVSVALIDQTAATFAPTITTANTISVALTDRTAVAFAPTITTANTISVNLINQAAAASAPTITTANTISVGQIDRTAATFAPTVTTLSTISVALIDQTASPFAPTITTGAAALSVGLIDRTASPFTPTITAGAVSVTPNFINQAATASAPTVTTLATIAPNLINQTATASAPSVSLTIFPNFINQTAATFTPTVTTASSISVALINQAAATFAPTVTTGAVNISVNRIDQTAVLYDPVASVGGTVVEVNRTDQTAVAFAPTVTTGAATISVALINQTATAFTPTVSTAATAGVGFINQTATAFTPTVNAIYTISVGQIDQTAAPFAPSISAASTISVDQINQTAQTFNPTVSVASGAQDVAVGRIDQPAQAFSIALLYEQTIELNLIDRTAQPFNPRVSARQESTGRGPGRWYGYGSPQRPPYPDDQFVDFAIIAVNPKAFSPSVEQSDDEVLLGLSDEDLLLVLS